MKLALKILIFCIVLGTCSGALLVGINAFTSEQIAKNEELNLESSVLNVLGIPYNESNALEVFKANVEIIKNGDLTFYKGKDQSVAFEFNGPGVWGPINGIISLSPDLLTIRDLEILHQEETPGLGGRIAEKKFLDQCQSKKIDPKLVFKKEGEAKTDNEVDAITGATYSCKALEKLLNTSLTNAKNSLR
jgi:Na+-transporting NADH:ubiquinone oxidoreductase subunit C